MNEEDRVELVASLFAALKHGDQDHKDWLFEAIGAFFAGKPVPVPRGSGNKEKRIAELEAELASLQGADTVTEAMIKHMANRFLQWRLPENFHPDAGISFEPDFNVDTPYPMKHQPTGTNLFDADQAEVMVRHMVDGLAMRTAAPTAQDDTGARRAVRGEQSPVDGLGET